MNYSRSSSEHKLEASFRNRLYFFSGLVVITLFIFILQLVNLQLIQGSENAIKAERFVRKSESILAARGQIYDRNFLTPETSNPLVSNSAALDLILNTNLLKNDPKRVRAFIEEFCKYLSIPKSYYEKELQQDRLVRKIRSREPFILLEGISKAQQERISVFDNINKYVQMVPSPTRIYNMGPALAHVTGYLGKPNREDILDKDIKSYQYVGKGGLESVYDTILRGTDGYRIQKRSTEGNIEEERIIEHAQSGNNLILTIDQEMQIAAYRALKGTRGTVIAIKPTTGEVLALASNPSFDPNILSGKNRQERINHYKQVIDNKGLLNLAIQSKFPPASTYKTLVALAALESEHKIQYDPSTEFHCDGKFTLKSTFAGVPDQVFRCWENRGHGTNDLAHAIEKSCSVYFYNLGYKLGSESILSYSRLFGLDKKSEIDLPGETVGFIPSSEWKKRTYGTKWFDGDTINLSIGQGFISTTPISITLFYSAIVNGGKVYQPFIVSEVRNPIDNSIIQRTEPKVIRDIPLKKSTVEAIKYGLELVGISGTASYVMNQPNMPEVAGKTGTAQTRRRGASRTNHAWFMGYAPANAPPDKQVLVGVFVEFGVGGSAGAAPVAREVFKAAFPPGSFPKSDRGRGKIMKEETPIDTEETEI
ncbi:penicillin-binding protein 2 [Leptospira sp. GIMC2001]|uniref:penicillin-binding protein 2 n=1 Tax=Leptospira sp. GIMC2001 TaxID=1513297 RepID=UPI0004A5C3E5|nr:penicillin-binding protein 2 [Leptospira sp. GIMC2001]AID56199.1 penicillin-binding protein 2 [Leptospira sp. GIMC2001]WCL50162.1 penicillin-binding protein 2 [Leptospira sp. GIMC2001]